VSIRLGKLASGCGEWLQGDGPETDVVLSSRLRLARNLKEYPFLTRIGPDERAEMVGYLESEIREAFGDAELSVLRLDDLNTIDKQILVERNVISRELADAEGPCAVAFDSTETMGIMIAEEDHLRLQALRPGLDLEGAWAKVDPMDDAIEARLDYAFSPKYGYLTACPTNVGTGMRASVMMHLPALVITKHIEKVYNTVAQMSLAVRGIYGEGTHAHGDIFQVSNQITLGKDERTILEEVQAVAKTITDYERRARKSLLDKDQLRLRDRLSRDLAALKNAYLITGQEALRMLSSLRLGANLGLIKNIETRQVNELILACQPAHIQARHGKELSTEERNAVRGTLMRTRLKSATV